MSHALTHQLPRRIFKADEGPLGDHARATQDIFDKIPVMEHRAVEDYYAEPMVLKASQEPFCVELVRIANVFALEQPVSACFGMLHFLWKPQQGGAVITKIGGLTPATDGATKFRFYYRITYRMA